MIRRAQKNVIFLLVATAIILACVPTLAPASTPIPTFDPNSISTSIVETVNAAATQTGLFTTPTSTPTFTFTPTRTPSETPTPTNTFVFILFSPTASNTITPTKQPAGNYECTLVSQSPEDNSIIGTNALFSMHWQVKNTGTLVWDSNNADYHYKSGAKLHKQPAYDLPKDVPPDKGIDIVVDMAAPAAIGKYSTTWAIGIGKKEFCKVSLTIKVK